MAIQHLVANLPTKERACVLLKDGLGRAERTDQCRCRLLVADRYSGSFASGGYLGVYSRMKQTWRLTLGEVGGEPSIILLNKRNGEREIKGIIRLDIGVRLAG
jgi:hypothetical protein